MLDSTDRKQEFEAWFANLGDGERNGVLAATERLYETRIHEPASSTPTSFIDTLELIWNECVKHGTDVVLAAAQSGRPMPA